MGIPPARRGGAAAGLLGLLLSIPAGAQTTSPVLVRDETGTVIRATRIAQPIDVDGRLDDDAYREVQPITDFIQQEPDEGLPSTERTEVWVLFDDEHIYFTCRCWHERPETIVANEMRRDSQNQRFHDNFGVILDTFHDGRNGVLFSITAIGGFTDALTTDERSITLDWNTIWENKVERFEGGWVAEMAIPFKSLRYGPGRDQTWGVNLRRVIREKNEYSFVVPMDRAWGTSNAFLRVSAAARLEGLQAPPAAKNLEIKPFAIANTTTDRVRTPQLNNELDGDAGFDVKFGVTKSLTADFTYNTDFAQVESDEAQVNLTRFALSFPEKREFFLEGAGLFTFGAGGIGMGGGGDAPTMFYSRRIGLSGSDAVPIIAGGRLTGKVGKWSVGALSIESDDDAAAGAAQTNFTVLRLRRDLFRRSTIGAMFSSRSASVAAPGGSNQMGGLDAAFSLSDNIYLSGYVARTRTPGMDGDDYSYRTQFTYSGDRYGVQLDRLAVEDHFNPEIGFLRRQDFRSSSIGLRFSPRPARNARVRQFHYEGSLDYVTNTSNVLESREQRVSFSTDLQNGDAFGASATRIYEFIARPFPVSNGVHIPVGGYSFDTYRVSFSPGAAHRMVGTIAAEHGGFYDGERTTATISGRLDITSRLAFQPTISLNYIDLPRASFSSTVFGGRGTYTLNPRTFVAALVQYTSSTTSLLTNVRLRWEYTPGSELFIVYSEGRDTLAPSGTLLENRGLAVKVTRLFRF